MEKFIIDADQLGALHSISEGVDISANAQAMDALAEVGPGGHFLGCDHTQRNFKHSFWRSNIFDYKPFETWSEEGKKDTALLASERVKEVLQSYQKPKIDQGIEEELSHFVQNRKKLLPDTLG